MKVYNAFMLATPIITAHALVDNSANSTTPIVTTKVTASYWRATFADPPFNIQNNAWFKAFYDLVDEISNDPEVKVVVFDSSAPDFWIAHYDIINPVLPEYNEGYWGNLTLLANLPILTIASVRGIARGGGAELATAFDVRFGSKEKALFGQIEVGTGGGGMSLLPRLAGRSRTLEIVLSSEDLDADTAAQYGWINRAILDRDFEGFVDSYARRVASFDKFAITEAKRIINKRSGYPKAAEQGEDFNAFVTAASQPNVQSRIAKFVELGLQTDVDFEIHADEEILQLVGEVPWNV